MVKVLLLTSLLFFSITSLAKDFEKIPKKSSGPWPTLIILHDIWGVDNFVKREAERYSEMGYYVYVIDFYSGNLPSDIGSANRFKDKLATEDLLVKVKRVSDRLLKNKNVDKLRLGILGWGWGGNLALRAAISNSSFRTVVMSYGHPIYEPTELKKIKAKGLALFGENDPGISTQNTEQFKKALAETRLNFDVKVLGGASTGFFDYTRTENFNPKASEEGKNLIKGFLNKHLALTEYVK